MIFTALQARADSKGLVTWVINVDSTIVRAFQHAVGARNRGTFRRSRPGGVAVEPGDTGWDARAAG